MGGVLGVLFAAVAAFLFFRGDSQILGVFSCLACAICLWSWLHMRYFACVLARQALYVARLRSGEFEEGSHEAQLCWKSMSIPVGVFVPFLASYSVSQRDVEDIPDWITGVNLVATLSGFALLIWSGIAAFF